MKKTKIQELEERIERLEKQQRGKFPEFTAFPLGKLFDSECLHNNCHHEKNPVCHLYCPHCGPKC